VNGCIELFKEGIAHCNLADWQRARHDLTIVQCATSHRQYPFLKTILLHFASESTIEKEGCGISALFAKEGALELLQWAQDDAKLPWNWKTPYHAAANGNVEVLAWAVGQRDCEVDIVRTFCVAVKRGHVVVLDCLLRLDTIVHLLRFRHSHTHVASCVVTTSFVQVIDWVFTHLVDFEGAPTLLNRVIRHGLKHNHAGKIAWARAHGCPWPKDACKMLARHQDAHLFKHAVADGADFGPEVARECTLHGSKATIDWLIEHGFVTQREVSTLLWV
jgi:hypothetical protein